MREATVLLVEGKNTGSSPLTTALSKEGLNVHVFHTGNDALSWIAQNEPDLVVFDGASMRSSGVRSCRRLRGALEDTPIIHTRAAGEQEDRAAGADVYLVQPYTTRKLMNRIRALLPADDQVEEVVRAGDLTFYLSKRSVDVRGQGERRLTPKLATLLEEFLRHPNEVLGREQLMRIVWDTNYFGDTRTLDVHIRWIREIIEENPALPVLLRTVRGVGYVFCVPQTKTPPGRVVFSELRTD
ncbi:MAG: response regulator transcription factor [Chloroflexi bacterium]|nr:response regulator transcription factor [Chloroflexota bacterium]MCI0580210.1 response regulator transcription factor [Chloroflexota bacterium]MCI0646939.1 response regulator transcription factor [Chloroflexota bacterium]MCI0728694.1 response regulator transcription factor [Chloroflexota bacterium]